MAKQIPKNQRDPNRPEQPRRSVAMESLRTDVAEAPAKLVSAAPNLEQSQVNFGQVSIGRDANLVGGSNPSVQIADMMEATVKIAEAGVQTALLLAKKGDAETEEKMNAELQEAEIRNLEGTPTEQTDLWLAQERERIYANYENQFTTRQFKQKLEVPRYENEIDRIKAPVRDRISDYKKRVREITVDPSFAALGELGEVEREKALTKLNESFYNMMEAHYGDNDAAMEAVFGAMGAYRTKPTDQTVLSNRILNAYDSKIKEQIRIVVKEMADGEQMYQSEAVMAADILDRAGLPKELREAHGGSLESLFLEKYNRAVTDNFGEIEEEIAVRMRDNVRREADAAQAEASVAVFEFNNVPVALDTFVESIQEEYFLQEDEELANMQLAERLEFLFNQLPGVYFHNADPEENHRQAVSNLVEIAGDLGVDLKDLPKNFYANMMGEAAIAAFSLTNQPSTILQGNKLRDAPEPSNAREQSFRRREELRWVEDVAESAARFTARRVTHNNPFVAGLADQGLLTTVVDMQNALIVAYNDYAFSDGKELDYMEILEEGKAKFASSEAQAAFETMFLKGIASEGPSSVLREVHKLSEDSSVYDRVLNVSLRYSNELFAGPNGEASPSDEDPKLVSPVARFESIDTRASTIRPTDVASVDVDNYVEAALTALVTNKDLMAHYDTMDGDEARKSWLKSTLENAGVVTNDSGLDALIDILKPETLEQVRVDIEQKKNFFTTSLGDVGEAFTTESERASPQYTEFVKGGQRAFAGMSKNDPEKLAELVEEFPGIFDKDSSYSAVLDRLYEAGIYVSRPEEVANVLRNRGMSVVNIGGELEFIAVQETLDSNLLRAPIAIDINTSNRGQYNESQGPDTSANHKALLRLSTDVHNVNFMDALGLVLDQRPAALGDMADDPIVQTLLSDVKKHRKITVRSIALAYFVAEERIPEMVDPSLAKFSIDPATGNLAIEATVNRSNYRMVLPKEFTDLLDAGHESHQFSNLRSPGDPEYLSSLVGPYGDPEAFRKGQEIGYAISDSVREAVDSFLYFLRDDDDDDTP